MILFYSMDLIIPRPVPFKSKQSGQGITEYLLIIFFVAALASIVAVAMKPVKEKVDFVLGDYLYCLIDEGELPSLGGESTVSECQKEFSAKMSEIKNSASANNSKNGDENGSDAKKNSNKSSSNRGSSGSGSQGGDNGGYSSGARIGRARNFKPEPTSADAGVASAANSGASTNGKVLKVGPAPSIIFVRAPRERAVGLNGLLDIERDKLQKRQQKIAKAGSLDEFGISPQKAKKFNVKPTVRKVSSDEIEAPGWDFGKIFRILIIVAIIIALVIFVGGQMAQISKSME